MYVMQEAEGYLTCSCSDCEVIYHLGNVTASVPMPTFVGREEDKSHPDGVL